MKTEDWDLIKTLYCTKNLTKASQLLFISQPALSKRIKLIEEQFGCLLIYRSNKGISFTPEGEYLARQAEVFLNLMDETSQYLRSMGTRNGRAVRIEAPSTFAKFSLVELLSEFGKAYPDIAVKVRVNVSSAIPRSIESHLIDCAFLLGDSEHKMHARLYDTQQCYAVYNKPITMDDLPRLPMILHNRNQATQHAVFQWWRTHFAEKPNIGITVLDLDTALDMVSQGLGYSIAFGSFLEKRSDFFLLPLYNENQSPFVRNTWFIYPDHAIQSPPVNCFINFVLNYIEHKKGDCSS